jgi:hypothetical protein
MEPADRIGNRAAGEIVTVETRLTDARRNLDQPPEPPPPEGGNQ